MCATRTRSHVAVHTPSIVLTVLAGGPMVQFQVAPVRLRRDPDLVG
jgi:hypothetical protein